MSNALHDDGKVRRGWFKFMLERRVCISFGSDETGMMTIMDEPTRRASTFYKYF